MKELNIIMKEPKTFEEAVEIILQECKELLLRKNFDYGTGNVSEFGLIGILVRIRDKTQRLKNLMGFNKDGVVKTPKVHDEKLIDTFMDVANYGILALLLERGWLELPNRVENPSDEAKNPVNLKGYEGD